MGAKPGYTLDMSILYRIRWVRVCATAALITAAVWGLGDWGAGERGDVDMTRPSTETLLANRPWLDHMPKNSRDMVSQLIFVDKDKKKLGAAMRASRWRQFAEIYQWKPTKNGVVIHLQQNDRRLWLQATVRECKGKAPKPFDLCLDIGLLGRGVTLYSKKNWKQSELAALQDLPFDPDATETNPIDVLELLDIE